MAIMLTKERKTADIAKTIAIVCQRGGVAKSTTAAALAQAAALKKKKILAVDTDPQGNLSFYLNADATKAGAYEVITGAMPAQDAIQRSGTGPDIIPASWALQTVTTSRGSARRLKNALESIADRYDFIIIDTPPTAGELQMNGIMAASDLIIPLQADIVAIQGLYQTHETISGIAQNRQDLTIAGYVLTRARLHTTLARQMAETIQQKAEALGIPCLGVIREAVALQEAQALQKNLYEYAPNSNPAADYMKIYNRLATRKRMAEKPSTGGKNQP